MSIHRRYPPCSRGSLEFLEKASGVGAAVVRAVRAGAGRADALPPVCWVGKSFVHWLSVRTTRNHSRGKAGAKGIAWSGNPRKNVEWKVEGDSLSCVMKIKTFILVGLAAGVSALTITSCAYDPYYSGGYGDGYGYGGSGFSTSYFVSTGSTRWAYDPYAGAYYDYSRRCYYDPYLNGYYPVGYRPRYAYGSPHPHGWSRGSGYCPPPSHVRSYNLTNYHDRSERYRSLGRSWSDNVRVDTHGGNHDYRNGSRDQRGSLGSCQATAAHVALMATIAARTGTMATIPGPYSEAAGRGLPILAAAMGMIAAATPRSAAAKTSPTPVKGNPKTRVQGVGISSPAVVALSAERPHPREPFPRPREVTMVVGTSARARNRRVRHLVSTEVKTTRDAAETGKIPIARE